MNETDRREMEWVTVGSDQISGASEGQEAGRREREGL